MKLGDVERLRGELAEFVGDVFGSLPRQDQRRWGVCYLRGLMLDGRRKSIQPMAERLPDGNMQALQQFVSQSPWDPSPVRRRIAQRLTEVIRPQVRVIDDVSFPKCGRASAGVARQYCGALGKRANCQVAVSVHAATDTASCPLDWQLYLPQEWTADPDRCRRAGIPDGTVHQEKWRLALGLLDSVTEWGLRAPVVVADAGYGVSTPLPSRPSGAGPVLRAGTDREGSRPRAGHRAPPAGLRRTGPTDSSPIPNVAAGPVPPRGRGGCRRPLR